MGKITITEELLGAVKRRLAQDNKNNGIDKGVWNVRLHRALETFVSEELPSLNPKLADYYKYDIADFFHQKTIDRAVKKEMKASKELFNALGYYAYGSEWLEKDVDPLPTAVKVDEGNKEEVPPENTTAKKNKGTFKWFFAGMGGLLIFFLFTKGCSSKDVSNDEVGIVKPTDNCDCFISRVGTNVSESDSSAIHTAIELKDWEGIEKVRELAKSKYGDTNPMLLYQEVDIMLRDIKSDFNGLEDQILTQHLIHSFHCAVDKLYCTDTQLSDGEKRQHRIDNLRKYGESIDSMLSTKKGLPTPMSMQPIKQEHVPASAPTFQIKGIPIGETSVKQISDITGLEYSNINKESIAVEIKLEQEAIALPNAPERYFQPATELSIFVNGSKCCCEKGELEIKKIGNNITGNPKHQIKRKVEERIESLIKEKNAFIVKKISSCLNSK